MNNNNSRPKHRKRPRRLNTSPPPSFCHSNKEEEENSYDAFEKSFDEDDWLDVKIRYRPLPLISSLLTLATQQQGSNGVSSTSSNSNNKMKQNPENIPLLAPLFERWNEAATTTINHSTTTINNVNNESSVNEPSQNEDKQQENNVHSTSSSPTTSKLNHQNDINHNATATLVITTSTNTTAVEEKEKPTDIVSMDNPKNSTLSHRHHERYFVLRNMQRRSLLSKKDRMLIMEWKQLKELIQKERKLYGQTIQQFREKHFTRFLLGFQSFKTEASKYVHISSQLIQQYKNRWKENNMPIYYGKCTQAISLTPNIQPSYNTSSAMTVNNEYWQVSISNTDLNFSSSTNENSDSSRSNDLSLESFQSKIISMQPIASDIITTAKSDTNSSDELGSNNIYMVDLQDVISLEGIILADDNKQRQAPSSSDAIRTHGKYVASLLCRDTHAHKLALEHGATTLMTSQTFATLLQTPGLQSTRWKVPMTVFQKRDLEKKLIQQNSRTTFSLSSDSNQQNHKQHLSGIIAILEDPVPHACTTRENLTEGFDVPFTCAMMNLSQSCPPSSSTTPNNDRHSNKTNMHHTKKQKHYAYTLIQMPSATSSHHKILVRTINDFFMRPSTNTQTQTLIPASIGIDYEKISNQSYIENCSKEVCPIRHYIQLEYFPERGYEQYTNIHRAQWIMEKLIQPQCHLFVTRINPLNGEILEIEEKTIAHATSNSDFVLSHHFGAIIQLAQALKSVRVGNHMLCFPYQNARSSRPICDMKNSSTISIHGSIARDSMQEDSVLIDMEKELVDSESVFMGKDALMSCFRMWKWMEQDYPGRIPYTFPTIDETVPKVV